MGYDGLVLAHCVYDAWGELKWDSNPTTYGYKGQWGYYRDMETGLLLLTHRYLDPASGRFLTRDPIGVEGGVNLYAYVGNNVTNLQDPLGYQRYQKPECNELVARVNDALWRLEHDWQKSTGDPKHERELIGRCRDLYDALNVAVYHCKEPCEDLNNAIERYKQICYNLAAQRRKKSKAWNEIFRRPELIYDPGLRECTGDILLCGLGSRAVQAGCKVIGNAIRCLGRLFLPGKNPVPVPYVLAR